MRTVDALARKGGDDGPLCSFLFVVVGDAKLHFLIGRKEDAKQRGLHLIISLKINVSSDSLTNKERREPKEPKKKKKSVQSWCSQTSSRQSEIRALSGISNLTFGGFCS